MPIKKQYFDMIERGEKLEEYRKMSKYYRVRFKNIFEMYPYSCIPTGLDHHKILLRNGYSSFSPTLEIDCTLDIGKGKEEWGALPDEEYYILKILNKKRII